MNVLLWVLQIGLSLFAFSGGAYKIFQFAELAKMPQTGALPQGAWTAFGIFEMACAVLLIVPMALKWMAVLTPLAAVALAIESVVLAAIFARYSLSLAATNPLVWVIGMGVVATCIAYGRYDR
jgi:hypothetical protein